MYLETHRVYSSQAQLGMSLFHSAIPSPSKSWQAIVFARPFKCFPAGQEKVHTESFRLLFEHVFIVSAEIGFSLKSVHVTSVKTIL